VKKNGGEGMSMPAKILTVAILCWSFSGPAEAQQTDEALRQAMALFDSGEWEKAVFELTQLIETGELSPEELSEARMALGKTYLGLDEEEKAMGVFKAIVRDDPGFAMTLLGEDEAATVEMSRYLGQAALVVRFEEEKARRERLSRTSRARAFFRSALLPGWGQRYQGHTQRGYILLGVTVASIVYAALAESDYRDARDAYAEAPVGSEFDALYDDYTSKADRADLALGVVGLLWGLNMIDAATQQPNLELPQGLDLTASVRNGGLHVACCARF